MCELIEEARVAAFAIALDGRDNTAALIRRLADALERSQAENERLRRERDRLFACIAEQEHRDNQRIGGNHVQFRHALETTMWALKSQTAPCGETAAALASHDREQTP